MELRHFRYFLALAEELHFGRAAARLHISQPPLSQQIQDLERELGAQLFYRTKHKVELSEAGTSLVEEARRVLTQVDWATRVVSRVSRGETGRLTIGTVTAEKPIVVRSLRTFAKSYPDVHIELRSLSSPAQLQLVQEGRLDVGFVILPLAATELVLETVAHEPLVAALPRQHPLSAQTRVPIRSLAGEPSVLFPRVLSPGYYDQLIVSCRNAGFSLNVVHEVDSIYTALALVAAGVGISLVPASLQDGRSKDIVFRELQGRVPRVECGMLYNEASRSSVLKSFVEVVRQVAQSKMSIAARK